MSRVIKKMVIDAMVSRLGETRDIVVVDTSKLDGVSMTKLRQELRVKQISAVTVPNQLANQALSQFGLKSLEPFLKGPSTLIWGGEDVVALSKEITKWAKELKEKLEIKGATVEGASLTPDDVESLSKSPGRVELISQISGLILSPGARLSAAILGAGGKLAGQVKKLADEEEGGDAAGASEASA